METQIFPKNGTAPQFSAQVCCGQTAGWIKMTLGTEIGLGPGDNVLNGDPAPLTKSGAQQFPLIFGSGIVAKRLDG